MRLTLQVEGRDQPVTPPGDGAALVAFMSFAVSRGFGAQHPLIALADRLHDNFHVRFGALTTFYDAVTEDAEDEAKLEQAWQPAASLRDALAAVACALETDEQCQALAARASASDLAGQARSLIPALDHAEAAGARVRLVYAL